MRRRVDVAVVGAGSAGLAALAEIRKVTQDYVLIDDGPLGTMCARSGCMPSKALIQVANDFHSRLRLDRRGIHGGRGLRLRVSEVLAFVRTMRDGFMAGTVAETKSLGSRLIRGRAMFVGPNELRVGDASVVAKRVVLATGSRPVVPADMLMCGAKVVTTETLFGLRDLPRRVGIVGLGPVGLELGQALSRLGCDVAAFEKSDGLGGLTDPAVTAYAAALFKKEFEIRFDVEVRLKLAAKAVRVTGAGRPLLRDMVLASLGRRGNLESVGLEGIGVPLGKKGLPEYDPRTMKVRGHPIFLAGDAASRRPILHEAVDDGKVAGYNSVHLQTRRFARRAPLSITFTDPNIALAGRTFAELSGRKFVTGAASFKTQARALIMGEAEGLLHVYADPADGTFLGAEMVGPAGEHLAHLMAWSLQQGLTVSEMLGMPFYHPTVEEGLRDALRDAVGKVKRGALDLSGRGG